MPEGVLDAFDLRVNALERAHLAKLEVLYQRIEQRLHGLCSMLGADQGGVAAPCGRDLVAPSLQPRLRLLLVRLARRLSEHAPSVRDRHPPVRRTWSPIEPTFPTPATAPRRRLGSLNRVNRHRFLR